MHVTTLVSWVSAVLVMLWSSFVLPVYAEGKTDIPDFVRSVSQEVVTAMNQTTGKIDRRQQIFAGIFQKYADVPSIARYVAGRSWRMASQEERDAYVATYRDYMALIYAQRLGNQSVSPEIKIGRVRDLGRRGYIVRTNIAIPGQQDLIIDWQLRPVKGHYKVIDLVIEQISMAQTQRAEFSGILVPQSNNDLTKLDNYMKARMR